jgi:hypothetical protein
VAVDVPQAGLAVEAVHLAEVAVGAVVPLAAADAPPAADIHPVLAIPPAEGVTAPEADTVATKS